MATDAIYCEQLTDAIIAELRAHLPANMTTAAWVVPVPNPPPAVPAYVKDHPLYVIQHGDLSDYAGPESVEAELPAILIRPLDVTPDAAFSGAGGVDGYEHRFRVVHIRAFDQCYTLAGAVETNMTRARARYAKAINQALLADVYGYMGKPTLTTADSSAAVASVSLPRWNIGVNDEDVGFIRSLNAPIWAISCDFSITVQVGPPTTPTP